VKITRSKPRLQLELWLGTLDVSATRVLDVGGGAKPVRGRTAGWDVGEYAILDRAPIQSGASDHQFSHNIGMPLPPDIGHFNVVFCLEVLEFVIDPLTAIRNLFELCSPGGTLYLSTCFVYPRQQSIFPDLLRFTPEGVEQLLDAAGFTIQEHNVRKADQGLVTFYQSQRMNIDAPVDHRAIGSVVMAQKPRRERKR
jgi:hypothetical protein